MALSSRKGNVLKAVMTFLASRDGEIVKVSPDDPLPVLSVDSDGVPVTGPTAAQTGAVDETAPTTDTASSGLNGRLQRIAQRLTTLLARWPGALGATTADGSLPVTLSTDGAFATQTGATNESAYAGSGSSGLNGILKGLYTLWASLTATLTSVIGLKTYLYDPATGAAFSLAAPAQVYEGFTPLNITTNTTTVVKSGAGTLRGILVGAVGTTEVLTLYDNTAGSGTIIATISGLTLTGFLIEIPANFVVGLTIVSSGGAAGNWTVLFR